uniref:Transcription initiation factor TFIID subunit n=1 Tax=Rhizophora mucronata TaxID=61149 RepID=A0A2P2KNM8_RHIMU
MIFNVTPLMQASLHLHQKPSLLVLAPLA